jgi:hypothetical protein
MINLKYILYELSNYNDNILIIISNNKYFNPLEEFSHIIKKKNLKIYLLDNNNYHNIKIKNDIRGEECEKNIKIIESISSIDNKNNYIFTESLEKLFKREFDEYNNFIYNIIYIYDFDSLKYIENLLNILKINISSLSLIYIYQYLSNESFKNIDKKNNIINNINYFFDYKINKLYSLTDFINIINENDMIKIKTLNIFKKNNYIVYGNNTLYEIILDISNSGKREFTGIRSDE